MTGVSDPVAVTLEYRQWMILLGWCEAHRVEGESSVMTDIFVAIDKTARDAA